MVFFFLCLFVNHLALLFLSLSICTNLSTKHKFILFFLSEGNPKTDLKGGYSGRPFKLFDKALVAALARVALVMCLQMRWLF